MEFIVVLDAAAPSARLNAGYGLFGGRVGDGPPTVLAVTCTGVDTTHSHLLRVTIKAGGSPVAWVPYAHVVGILEGPTPAPATMGFTVH